MQRKADFPILEETVHGASQRSQASFSAFRSAAEQAEMKKEEQAWDNEGGHMSSTAGRIVQTPGADLPYKAILALETGETTEHPFATMQEAEAFIRRNTPRPLPKSTT